MKSVHGDSGDAQVKMVADNKEFKKLLNKLQSVSEVESRKEKDIYTAFNKAWGFYSFGKKQDLKEYHENDIAKNKQQAYIKLGIPIWNFKFRDIRSSRT